MSGVLAQILAEKRAEVATRRAQVGDDALAERAAAAPATRDFAGALRRRDPKPRVIAEIKRASPSAGPIRMDADPAAIGAEYEAAGAAAVSVLTDEKHFGGALAHVGAVRARVGMPILRKDFVVDAYQLLEARAAGADAALLIVAALTDEELRSLGERAAALGLAALIEVHDAAEARRAVAAGARIIGVNHRDLRTLQMNMDLFAQVAPLLPAGTITVAESGIRSAADVRRMADAGADAILVGEHLMRQASPGAALRELLA